jgi:kynurenine formamidase
VSHDLSRPITSGSVFRLGSPPIEVTRRQFHHESEGHYESTILSLPAHAGTHVDLVFPGTSLAPDRMIGRGMMLDVRGSARIGLAAVAEQGEPAEGDFVFFRTGWDRFAGTPRYYDHPQLAPEVIQWLVSRKVNAVGIDALGLARDRQHGEYDRLLAGNRIFVIENLVNLDQIAAGYFRVYCLPLRIDDTDAIPARVLVETDPRD